MEISPLLKQLNCQSQTEVFLPLEIKVVANVLVEVGHQIVVVAEVDVDLVVVVVVRVNYYQ